MAFTITADARKETKTEVSEDKIPGVLYGFQVENIPLVVDAKEIRQVYLDAGENQVVEIDVAGKKVDTLIREVQIHPIKRNIIHVDFYAIDSSKPVEINIPLDFVGVAPAVKTTGGSLVKSLDSLHVRSLPRDFVKDIAVPLGVLESLEDSITVQDLQVKESWEVLNNPDDMVASVVPPKIETEPEQTPAELEAEAVAAGEKKPEGAEGEAKAEGDKK